MYFIYWTAPALQLVYEVMGKMVRGRETESHEGGARPRHIAVPKQFNGRWLTLLFDDSTRHHLRYPDQKVPYNICSTHKSDGAEQLSLGSTRLYP